MMLILTVGIRHSVADGDLPQEFPVLVVSPKDGRPGPGTAVIDYDNLSEYVERLKSYSLAVPEGALDVVNRLLSRQPQSHPVLARGHVKMRRLPKSQQSLEVSGKWFSDCYTETAWYTTDGRDITPLYYRRTTFPPLAAIQSAVSAFILNALLWIVGLVVYFAGRAWLREVSRQS